MTNSKITNFIDGEFAEPVGGKYLDNIEPATGKAEWIGPLGVRTKIEASPTGADDKIYFTSNQANCAVVKAEPKFHSLATNKLDEGTLATPAISNGKLFIRTDTHLYCIAR